MVDEEVKDWRPELRVRASHDVQHRLEAQSGQFVEPDVKVCHLRHYGRQMSPPDCLTSIV